MTLLQALILGLLQGLTEFLPVSSSGHLALAGAAFGLEAEGMLLEVALHAATLAAVLVVLRRDVLGLLRGAVDLVCGRAGTPDARLLGLLVLGTLPVVVVGFTLKGPIEDIFHRPVFAAAGLLATGGILLLARFRGDEERPITPRIALLIGLAQALAILPGVSRSGTTIVTALLLGVAARGAFTFSFLLSIPAILGATVLVVPKALEEGGGAGLPTLGIAALAAFLSGLIALVVLRRLVQAGRLALFAPYCLALGAVALVLLLW